MRRVTEQKGKTMGGIIYLILFAVFNLFVFFIFKKHSNIFWTSYAFMCVAFLVQIASLLLAFKTADVEAAFFGIPIASFSIYYFFAAIFVGAVFMIFQSASFKLAFLLQVVILAAYAIILIVSILARDHVQDVSDTIKESATAVKMLRVDIDSLIPLAQDAGLKAALKHLSETVRYSDPMSNSSVADLEDQIMQKTQELRVYCENGSAAEAAEACRQTELLFVRRNATLKASK